MPVSLAASATILDLKQLVSAKSSDKGVAAPPADYQRLLFKGKALVDARMIKEYDLAGAVVNLVMKPGWDKAAAAAPAGPSTAGSAGLSKDTSDGIPALTISQADPSAENTSSSASLPARPLTTLDISPTASANVPSGSTSQPLTGGPSLENTSAQFHHTIADPQFWQKVYELCQAEFMSEQDAEGAWGVLFGGMRERLSPSEIAKVQDVVGITGEWV